MFTSASDDVCLCLCVHWCLHRLLYASLHSFYKLMKISVWDSFISRHAAKREKTARWQTPPCWKSVNRIRDCDLSTACCFCVFQVAKSGQAEVADENFITQKMMRCGLTGVDSPSVNAANPQGPFKCSWKSWTTVIYCLVCKCHWSHLLCLNNYQLGKEEFSPLWFSSSSTSSLSPWWSHHWLPPPSNILPMALLPPSSLSSPVSLYFSHFTIPLSPFLPWILYLLHLYLLASSSIFSPSF